MLFVSRNRFLPNNHNLEIVKTIETTVKYQGVEHIFLDVLANGRLARGWTVRGSNPGGEFSAPVQTGPAAHPASCTMGTGSFPRVKSGRGVTLTPHPLSVVVMKLH
jgi:hypothetical protein